MQTLDEVAQVSFSPLLRRYTLEEFFTLPDPDDPAWETRQYSADDWAESRVLGGWRVSVAELFEGLAQ